MQPDDQHPSLTFSYLALRKAVGLIGILVTVLLAAQACQAQDLTDNHSTVKILSFNIYHGATTRGDYNLDAIARVITDADPDIVALQEVDLNTNRSGHIDLATELGIRTHMTPLFGRAMYYDGGEYGEGILSKYSFITTRNVPLPYTTGNEPRTALEAVVLLPSGDTISFVGTHFDHLNPETDRVAQAEKINEVFASGPYPVVLAGDLNAQPGSNPIKILEEIWSASYDKINPEPTFPSDAPRIKIDYVMHFPAERWETVETKVICDSIASDHCAYLVTLKLLNE
jgi:endonuclease/exonuclease/phosphatase family metal-dependent hydrolase